MEFTYQLYFPVILNSSLKSVLEKKKIIKRIIYMYMTSLSYWINRIIWYNVSYILLNLTVYVQVR